MPWSRDIFAAVIRLALLVAFLGSLSAYGQKLIVCKEFNNLGNPYKEGYEWELPPDKPLVISFLYNNGITIVNHTSVIFKVECLTDSKVPVDRARTQVGQARNWVARRHEIDKPGSYQVSVFIEESKVFASAKFEVRGVRNTPPPAPEPKKPEPVAKKPEPKPVVEEKPAPKPVEEKPIPKIEMKAVAPTQANVAQKDLDVDMLQPIMIDPIEEPVPDRFRFLFISFGRGVQSGMLTGQNEKFKLNKDGTDITTMFTNTEAFNTKKVTVKIWRKGREAKDYSEFVTQKDVAMNPEQMSVHINHLYTRPGDYKVSIFDEEDTLLGTSYVRFYIYH